MTAMGGSSGGSSTTTTQQVYSPAEEAARAKIFATGGSLYDQQAPGAGQYRGPGVVDFSDPSKQAFGAQMATANAAMPTSLDALRGASFNINDARYVGSNPYAADAIKAALNPVVQNFSNSVMPTLRLGAAGNGTGMSTRQGIAEGLATQALLRQLSDTSSSMASGMYGQGLSAATQTMGMLPNIMSGAQAPAAMMSQVGTTLENQSQAQENFAAAKRLQETQGPWQLLQNWASLVGGMSNPTTTTTQTGGSRSGMSPLQMGGGLMGLTGLLGGLFN